MGEELQFQASELSGVEVSRTPGGEPILGSEELKEGDVIYSPGLSGGILEATVSSGPDGVAARSGRLTLTLERTGSSDPRGDVWVCTGFINMEGLRLLELHG